MIRTQQLRALSSGFSDFRSSAESRSSTGLRSFAKAGSVIANFFAAGVLALALAACSKPAPVAVDDTQLMERKHSWETNFNKGDAAAVVELYGADARLLMTGTPPAEGTAAIQTAVEGMIKSGVKVKLGVDGHSISPDIAYVHGKYSVLTGDPVPKELEHGDYVEVWRLVDGVWKLTLDMNSAAPTPVPAAAPGA